MNTTSLSVTDIVKGSIVDTFTEQFAALTPLSVVVALVMGFLVGLISRWSIAGAIAACCTRPRSR